MLFVGDDPDGVLGGASVLHLLSCRGFVKGGLGLQSLRSFWASELGLLLSEAELAWANTAANTANTASLRIRRFGAHRPIDHLPLGVHRRPPRKRLTRRTHSVHAIDDPYALEPHDVMHGWMG